MSAAATSPVIDPALSPAEKLAAAQALLAKITAHKEAAALPAWVDVSIYEALPSDLQAEYLAEGPPDGWQPSSPAAQPPLAKITAEKEAAAGTAGAAAAATKQESDNPFVGMTAAELRLAARESALVIEQALLLRDLLRSLTV